MDNNKKPSASGRNLYTSILLFLIALVCISAATVAWFSIADFTRVNSINMQIVSGANFRFDLDPHQNFEDYVKTLTFREISERIKSEKKFDMTSVPLEPVTTSDALKFTFENGSVVKSDTGAYLEFILHFMATSDMVVHLTSENSDGNKDGTAILSENAALAKAMRISFTIGEKSWIYDPGMENRVQPNGNTRTFGLPSSDQMVYNDANAMFPLNEEVDQPVVVHIWLEGTDEACTNDLKGAEYSIRMRFAGTDEENRLLDENRNTNKKASEKDEKNKKNK